MRQILNLLVIVIALSTCCGSVIASASNQLSGHPSPYLALYADDSVHWQSWQAVVFEQVRTSNRLVLVSVGYISCHWCHVMQRQSYQHAMFLQIKFATDGSLPAGLPVRISVDAN